MTSRQSVSVRKGDVVTSRRGHVWNGFPHFNRNNGACMCKAECCQGPSGCCCRGCSGVGHENCLGARARAAQAAELEANL